MAVSKTLLLAGVPIEYQFRYKETVSFYKEYFTNVAPVCKTCIGPEEDALVAQYYQIEERNYHAEIDIMTALLSDTLLPYNRVVFHSVAMLWNKKVWLFAAPSGTGKTTQYLLWKKLFPREVYILNGDKPFLSFDAASEIRVWPSPWKGKEGFGIHLNAPLGGLILLKQAVQNQIRKATAGEAVDMIISQYISLMKTEADIKMLVSFTERILQDVPIYLLENKGDRDSAEMAHTYILQSISHTYETAGGAK